MKIGFVTQWFPPEPAYPPEAIVDGLVGRGHQVEVLTGFPNYPSGVFHPDYPVQRYRCEERADGVIVHRAPLYPSHDQNALARSANYLTFAFAAAWAARRRMQRPDVWLVYSSPATSAIPVLAVPDRLRAPLGLLVPDLWPDSVLDSGFVSGRPREMVRLALNVLCDQTYRASSAIGVTSPGMRSLLIERGVPEDRIHFTPIWSVDRAAPTGGGRPRAALGLPAGPLFIYAGNIGKLQGLAPLVEAFTAVPEASLVMVGAGVCCAELESLALVRRATNVRFLPWQAPERLDELMTAADYAVVSLQDTALLRATMPSKVYSSLAAGKPILVHAAGDAATLVTESGAGKAATPGDRVGTVDAIRRLAATPPDVRRLMGLRARACYERRFTAEAGAESLERMVESARAAGPLPADRRARAQSVGRVPAPRVPGERTAGHGSG